MLKNNNSIAFVLDLVPMARYTWHLMTFTPTCVFDIKPDCALIGFDRASSAIFVRFWWSYLQNSRFEMAKFHPQGQDATKRRAKMKEFIAFLLTFARSGARSYHREVAVAK